MTLWSLCAYTQNEIVLLYESGEYVLNQYQKQVISEQMSQCENCMVKVEGHTDSDASEMFNMSLSKLRSAEVVDFIETHIQVSTVDQKNYGEGMPVSNNAFEHTKAKNRRVRITWQDQDEIQKKDWKKEEHEESLIEKVTLASRGFEIDHSLRNRIVTPKGIEFLFTSDASLGVSKYEFFETTDQKGMLENSLHTMTAEGVLESSYMYCLRNISEVQEPSFYISIPSEYIEGEDKDWYELVDGNWVNQEVLAQAEFRDSCNCYVMEVSSGCFNVDKPVKEKNERLTVKYDGRTLVRKYVFGLFKKYKNLEPEFYFFPEGVNAGINPSRIEKRKIYFNNYKASWSGEVVGVAQYKGQEFVASMKIESGDTDKSKRKMTFGKRKPNEELLSSIE